MRAGTLVTGGAGFIGSQFVRQRLQREPTAPLVVLDSLTYAGHLANLAGLAHCPGFCFVQGDIGDTPLVVQLLQRHAIATVVHFAAESHVDRSIAGPDAFVSTNIVGTHSLLKAARAVWLAGPVPVVNHRFHHVSTDEVYGSLGLQDPPCRETTAYAPNSPYAASKAASDLLVRAYHRTYGLLTTMSHGSNNYGPCQFPEKLLPVIIRHGATGTPIPLYGEGANRRDWIHVADHCQGIEAILQRGQPGESYNLGGNHELSNRQLMEKVCDMMDLAFAKDPSLAACFPQAPAGRGLATRTLITQVPDRPGHDFRYAIDSGKARDMLGFQPVHALEQGLYETIRWYLDHPTWWQGLSRE